MLVRHSGLIGIKGKLDICDAKDFLGFFTEVVLKKIPICYAYIQVRVSSCDDHRYRGLTGYTSSD